MIRYRSYLCICLLGLSGCGIFEQKPDVDPDSLGGMLLEKTEQPSGPQFTVPQPIPKTKHKDIVTNYQKLLLLSDDPEITVNLQQRLAELEMVKSDNWDAELETDESNPDIANPSQPSGQGQLYNSSLYADTIAAYIALLAAYPDRPENDELLYQLSKAYELNMQLEEAIATLAILTEQYPDSVHWVEAQFRTAEYLFSDTQYLAAEDAYQSVVKHPDASSFYKNSLYMLGWSQFKQELYDATLDTYITLLDYSYKDQTPPAEIDLSRQQQLGDVMRVMSWIFTERDGADSIKSLFHKTGSRQYEHLLYSRLATEHLEKKRYLDSTSTYQAYIDQYPNTEYAAIYFGRKIDAYKAGSFLDLAFKEKQAFVTQYGNLENFAADGPTLWLINNQHETHIRLKQYTHELATHYHATAQKAKDRSKRAGEYQKATYYYGRYVLLFPTDPATPEAYYFLAETLYQTNQYSAAIRAYEQSAYQYPVEKHSADAGYGAVHSYQKLLSGIPAEQIEQYNQTLSLKIESQLRFSERFRDDSRISSILTITIEELFTQNRYQESIDTAARLLARPLEDAQPSQIKTAQLITAHSLFALQRYAESEAAYLQLRDAAKYKNPTQQQQKEYRELNEQFAASIYKQAEQANALGDSQQATDHFLRIIALAPDSTIRSSAQYDVIVQMTATEQWNPAVDQILDFRTRFPNNPLNANTPHLLITALQNLERWPEAADELIKLSNNSKTADEKRATLFLAAQTYEKANSPDQAIRYYKQYAHAYPIPLDDALESRHRLEQLYHADNADSKRRYWLNKIITLDSSTPKAKRTDRSRYLAAQASLVFAEDSRVGFEQIKLTLPLSKSIKKKKKSFDKTIEQYNRVLEYQVAEFSTIASFKMAAIYQQLSADLMASQRPANLNELELEQYEMLLEEQAYPFEEEAIALHESNVQKSWVGIYDKGVKSSFESLSELLPARYNKHESVITYSHELF
ncbi:MAG: tetratricopeptide repeat protein [Pseudomonadales bacterium]|nr:tetratricopeptide repeat protein [Pseudomonadales bacterium]